MPPFEITNITDMYLMDKNGNKICNLNPSCEIEPITEMDFPIKKINLNPSFEMEIPLEKQSYYKIRKLFEFGNHKVRYRLLAKARRMVYDFGRRN